MPHFKIDYLRYPLELKHTFTIARGSKSEVQNVFVRLSAEGHVGYGEAAPNKRYNETAESVELYLRSFISSSEGRIQSVDELNDFNESTAKPNYSALSALEMAWFDWLGKSRDTSVQKIWNAPRKTGPQTTYTIGIDSPEIIKQKVREAEPYPILKVKLGTEHDREIIHTIRQLTGKPVRVDINEGWTDLETAKNETEFLVGQDITFIEQPMPASQKDLLHKFHAFSPVPICADESFRGKENLDEISELFDCINIKLAKIGSMQRALQVIREARKRDLHIMIGCMVESSLADTAAAILSLWAEYADLDGHLLIKNDPFKGILLDEEARIRIPDTNGLGVKLQTNLFNRE